MWRLRTHLLVAAGGLAFFAFLDRFATFFAHLDAGGGGILKGGLLMVFTLVALVARKRTGGGRETFQRLLPIVKGPLQSALSENPGISPRDLGARLLTAVSGRIADRGILKALTTSMDTLLPALVRSLRASGDLAVDWEAMPPVGAFGLSATMQWMLVSYLLLWAGAVVAAGSFVDGFYAIHGPHRDMTPIILIGVGITVCGAAGVVISEWWARRSSSGTLAYQRKN